MKKRLVIIAGYFYPDTSPTGKVAMQFADLLKETYDVSIISIQTGTQQYCDFKWNGLTLHSLYNWRTFVDSLLKKRIKTSDSDSLKRLYRLAITFIKIFGHVSSWFIFPRPKCYSLWPNNLTWFYKKAYKKLTQLHQESPIDYLFTINSPFPAHLTGLRYKSMFPDVKWVTYTVDPYARASEFTQRYFLKQLKLTIDVQAEQRVYSNADHNFVSEEVHATDQSLFSGTPEKTSILPYILPNNISEVDDSIFSKEKINVVYAGSFYETIRNPKILLKTFLALNDPTILLHLFVSSDCDRMIDNFVLQSQNRIIRHLTVSHEKVLQILSQSDILLSLGNSTPAFKPSKIFEYISTGKSIIHFYQNGLKEDVLNKYQLTLQIDQEKLTIEDISIAVKNFCYKNKGQVLDYDKISEMYPEHSVSRIKEQLMDVFNN